jgi:protein TonB
LTYRSPPHFSWPSLLVGIPLQVQSFEKSQRIEFTPQIVETQPVTKRPPKVKPRPRVQEPIRTGIDLQAERRGIERGSFTTPKLVAAPPLGGLTLVSSGVDNDVVPRVRLNPVYPPQALARGIEGWVAVRFTVTAAGTVRDAVVVASELDSSFDAAALEAIAGWRYTPRIEKGEAVECVGLQTVIRFELDN